VRIIRALIDKEYHNPRVIKPGMKVGLYVSITHGKKMFSHPEVMIESCYKQETYLPHGVGYAAVYLFRGFIYSRPRAGRKCADVKVRGVYDPVRKVGDMVIFYPSDDD